MNLPDTAYRPKRFLRNLLLVVTADDPLEHDVGFVNFDSQVPAADVGIASKLALHEFAELMAWVMMLELGHWLDWLQLVENCAHSWAAGTAVGTA